MQPATPSGRSQIAASYLRQRRYRPKRYSVSQALYGIALGSQTAHAALTEDGDTASAARAAEYVHKLAEAAIAEMRALIFELRPESLEQEGLVVALERHAESLRARHDLRVEAHLDAEPESSPDVKEALYRIAQEAMHNAVKHAHARSIHLRLANVDGLIRLEVADDGVGFDPTVQYTGHLGLISMRERAIAVGGDLAIHSAAGRGTRIVVGVPRQGVPRVAS